MSGQSSIPWFNDFLGIAYRYYDLRMNVVPLFSERKTAVNIWNETIHWWLDHTIKIRFVEEQDDRYWFVMAAESKRPENNQSFFKFLSRSEHYDRFKKGHEGEAYLRLGTYAKKFKKDVKDDAVCQCGHVAEDHEKEDDDEICMVDDCSCRFFESFQVNLLKKKKIVTDIKFLTEDEVKDDPLTWNCLYVNKYKDLE